MKSPFSTQMILCLIKEELKSRKFFNTLRSLSLDNSYYQPHLDELILSSIGLDDERDETFDFYHNIMERYSASINENEKSMMGEAVEVCIELMGEARGRIDVITLSQLLLVVLTSLSI